MKSILAKWLATLLVVFSLTLSRADHPYANYWGAIAYSQSTGKWGYSRHWLSKANAQKEALENCKAADATLLVVVGNYWCALALGDDTTAFGYGYGDTPQIAQQHAMQQCAKRTKHAHIVVSFSTRDDN